MREQLHYFLSIYLEMNQNFSVPNYNNVKNDLIKKQEKHDAFVKQISQNPNLEYDRKNSQIYSNVLLLDEDGLIRGETDIAILNPLELILIEAKLMFTPRKSRINNKENKAIKQLKKQREFFMEMWNICPTCYYAIKTSTGKNQYKIGKVEKTVEEMLRDINYDMSGLKN